MGPRLLHRRGAVPHYEDLRIRDYWEGLKKRRELMLECQDRIALVIPRRLCEWFAKTPATLSVKSEPTVRTIPTIQGLQSIWEDFLYNWATPHGSLFCFNPEQPRTMTDDPGFDLERSVRKRTRTEEPHPVLNCLPDVWIALSETAAKGVAGTSLQKEDVEWGFSNFVCQAYDEQEGNRPNPRTRDIEQWLSTGDLRLIRISGAESNSRFLGERIWDPQKAFDLLVHSALALGRSTRCLSREDFEGSKPAEASSSEVDPRSESDVAPMR
jgi:hypothetical protein